MLKRILLTLCVMMSAVLTSYAQSGKTIVVYFSETGTTKAVAEKIAKATDSDIAAIVPTEEYTTSDLDWRDKTSRCYKEMTDEKARPACKKIDIAKYDVVYLGFPIWFNLAPRVINSFIETHNLKGKRIIPFATSGSSQVTNAVRTLRKTYPDLDIQDGKRLNGVSQADVDRWVKQ